METVCEGKQWDVLLSQRDGHIEGALPYLIGRKFGMKYILQPQLTQICGPWYNHPDTQLVQQSSNQAIIDFEHRIGGDLAAQLNALGARVCIMHFSPTVTDWLPFRWAGYQQTTRYTYRFTSIAAPDALFAAASRGRKQNMADVESCCTLDIHFDPSQFARMHCEYFERKKGEDLLSQELIEHVCRTALERGQGLLWALRNTEGKPVNVSFVVYDDRCAYALMSAITPEAPRNSQTYLFWQIIRHLSGKTQAFDFEGSMDKGNEYFYRTFGTTQTPFFEVSRFRPRFLSHFFRG